MFLHWEIYFEFECHSPQSNQSISISTFKWTDILECFEIVILFKWTIILFCKCNVLLHSSIPQKSWNLTCKQYFISQVRITPNQGAARHQIWCPKLSYLSWLVKTNSLFFLLELTNQCKIKPCYINNINVSNTIKWI